MKTGLGMVILRPKLHAKKWNLHLIEGHVAAVCR